MSAAKLTPDEDALKEAAEIEILNSKGGVIKFGSLFEKDKTVVVFIRKELHFLSKCSLFNRHRSFLLWCK